MDWIVRLPKPEDEFLQLFNFGLWQSDILTYHEYV